HILCFFIFFFFFFSSRRRHTRSYGDWSSDVCSSDLHEIIVDGAGDSDHNDFVAQEATVTASLGSDLRGTLRAGWRHATDPRGDGSSYWGGANLIAALGHGAVLRAGLGARRVQPDGVAARTPFTAEVGLGLRPARYAAVSVGYSRTPFDETAGLMRQDLTVDAVDLSLDMSPGP